MQNAPLRLGIAGLGTVGVGVVRTAQQNAALIAARAGRPVVVTGVCARSRDRDRGIALDAFAWEDDPIALARRDDVDVFVEVMGGHEGAARDAILAALDAGKDVVTANKALLALHGQDLALCAEAAGRQIRYEAAVAGGIPVIKALSEGLAANRITRVMGVMNGSCNYILTRMQSAGLSYADVFAEAMGLGYLEADPNLDVGGIDAGHKLAILASLAFGTRVDFGGVELEGIGAITIEDIRQAHDLGFRIKLLGVAQMTGRGLEQRMQPCLVPSNSPLGQLEGGTNMVVIEGDPVGQIVLRGPGAGEGPTASAVMADICDLARGTRQAVFGQPAKTLTAAPRARSALPAPYYLRLMLQDKPGALAKVAASLGDEGVSIHRMRQYDHTGDAAPVVIVTHKTTRGQLDLARDAMSRLDVITADPVALRIEQV